MRKSIQTRTHCSKKNRRKPWLPLNAVALKEWILFVWSKTSASVRLVYPFFRSIWFSFIIIDIYGYLASVLVSSREPPEFHRAMDKTKGFCAFEWMEKETVFIWLFCFFLVVFYDCFVAFKDNVVECLWHGTGKMQHNLRSAISRKIGTKAKNTEWEK